MAHDFPSPPVRVIKLGGSLLDLEGLVPRLRCWLDAQPAMVSVMIVGGGSLADTVRAAYSRHELSEEAAHWQCIRMMSLTAKLVARQMPEAVLVDRYGQLLPSGEDSRLRIFDSSDFLRQHEPRRSACPLPHTWDVTSDSIAARVAEFLGAEELVLLKSAPPPPGLSLEQLSEAGYVDRYFPIAAAGQTVRCLDLRGESMKMALVRPKPRCEVE